MKYLFFGVLVLGLALATPAGVTAAMNGQILNCDSPNPTQPQGCVDNWALDLLDEGKTAIQSASGALPRDRKHYFDGNGTGVHVFILDTGVDGTNPDFKVLGNPAQDRFGVRYGSFNNVDPEAGSHGTRVAGLAAGLQYGVAKGATIHPILSSGWIKKNGAIGILDRLNWIYDRVTIDQLRPAVLNMSFNIPRPVTDLDCVTSLESQLTQRVRDLINAGVVVTVSAGNQSSSNPGAYWPSVIPEVILVGGIDENGNRWTRDTSDPDYNSICVGTRPPGSCDVVPAPDCGSNYGSLIYIWAPAKYIRSAVKINNNDTAAPRIRSGTSFAAPLVAGLAALHLQQSPTDTPAQVLSALKANAAVRNVDGVGALDYIARSPVATPACNVPQRLFVNTGRSVNFTSIQLADSCPAGYTAYPQFNAAHGQIAIGGIAPEGISYYYTPTGTYTGTDLFNYTIYTGSGSSFGTGSVNVTVQPNHN